MPAGTRTRIWPWRALAFLFLLSLPRASLALEVTRGPSLQVLTGTSATVEWDTDVSAGCSLEIGPVDGATTTIAGSTATHCEFPLQNLTPQTDYQYVPKGNGIALASAQLSTLPAIRTVFIILMENKGWSEVKSAPYIAHLAATGAHAENYRTSLRPSEPNYIVLEAGTTCPPLADGAPGHCFTSNDDPTGSNHTASPFHLVRYLEEAGISWKAYQEGISGSNCPLTGGHGYAPKHIGMIFFDDVTGASDPSDRDCIAHFRPYSELARDLAANRVARYNFITPDLCHDMHDCSVAEGDAWLSEEVPRILGSAAYRNGGLLILTWDEDHGSPIPLILNSPAVQAGYFNTIAYSHPSTVRTLQEIFGVVPPRFPWLGDAATAKDLSNLFTHGSVPVTTTTTTTLRRATSTTTTTTLRRSSTTTTTRRTATSTTSTTLPPLAAGLVNPGFEAGEVGWRNWRASPNHGEAVVSRRVAHVGAASLQMFDSARYTRMIFQDVAARPGKRYRYGAIVRGKNLGHGQAQLRLQFLDAAGRNLASPPPLIAPPGTYGWRALLGVASAPQRTSRARVMLLLAPVTDGRPANDAEIWFDDVRLNPGATATRTPSTGRPTTTTTLPRSSSCLRRGGPLASRAGTYGGRVTFDDGDLSPGLRVDARRAVFLAGPSNLYPLVFDRGQGFFRRPERQQPEGVCVAGGLVLGQFPRTETWAQSKSHSGAGIEFWPGGLTIDGVRIDNVHDGIRPQDGNDWTIRGAHLSWIRDDCVEDDHMRSGLITDSLFDGCYVFVSTRASSPILSEGWDGTDEVVRVENSLVHMQPMPGPDTGTLDPGWGTTWKWLSGPSSKSPKLSLHRNVFRYDQVGGSGAASMEVPPGKLLDCSDNVVVWLGRGPFPAKLPSCFTVTTNRAVWDRAVAAWKARHP